jgi:protein-L-isoaspartate(D-aspartate) O-methyltransferase
MSQQLHEAASQLDQMIQTQVIDRGIRDPRVIEALRAVPREKFFPAEHRDEAFADRAAPIGHGQTISQPYMVALMTQRLSVGPTDRVLEIGTGSGYQTAILAKLAAKVYTIERVKPLLDEAWERLMEMGIRNVHFHFGDGTQGWPARPGEPLEPFDRILIAAGAPSIPRQMLLSQLKDGGIAVLPVGPHNEQMLVAVIRDGEALVTDEITPVRFVRLVGREGWPDEGSDH